MYSYSFNPKYALSLLLRADPKVERQTVTKPHAFGLKNPSQKEATEKVP
jgi:hypothetical protein